MERLTQWVNDGSVDTVIVAGIDLQGRLYGKRVAAVPFLRDMPDGVHTCDCNLGWDIERMLIPDLALTGWHTGYGDLFARVDWSTLRRYPWFPKTALVLCDTCGTDGDLLSIAPRTLLKRQLERAKAKGFEVKAASELEFFLFNETARSSLAKNFENLETSVQFITDYSIYRSSMDEPIIGAIRRHLTEAGVDIECSKAEWGCGQHEVNLVYDEALEMADRHAIFKNGVREIAALHGMQVTFMAKWHVDHSSNGCHMHMSLWKDGQPAFFDPQGERGVAEDARHFLGGMMAAAKELQLFYAPTINSYKRYGHETFAPTTITWGGDNRTVAFRMCGHEKSMRVENRIPGADANPYLAMAAMIGAGLHGMENKIEPLGPFVEASAYAVADAPRLNRDLEEALAAFNQSELARALFGEDVVEHYARIAQWEIDEFKSSVTDWERRRYFERI